MVVFRGILFSTLVVGTTSSTTSSCSEFKQNNPHRNNYDHNPKHNFLHNVWGKARSDVSALNDKGGHVLETIRKQSRIKISDSINHIASDTLPSLSRSLSSPFKSAIQCGSNQLQLPFKGRGGSTATKRKKQNNSGFYYGIRDDVFFAPKVDNQEVENNDDVDAIGSGSGSGSGSGYGSDSRPQKRAQLSPPRQRERSIQRDREALSSGTLTDIMGETLLELREMREDIYALREEMQYMKEELKRQQEFSSGYGDQEKISIAEEDGDAETYGYPRQGMLQKISRKNEFEQIGQMVEKWAHKLLFEEDGEEYGWKEVKCNKMVRKKFNDEGRTTCYIKWMKDARGKHANGEDDDKEYPCVKVFTTINAPMDDVCEYLSEEKHMGEYNDLVVAHRDLENISPHGKICWSQCPQILFIKPRDFVTYCHHRWRRDGTQIVVSQACDHEDAPGTTEESDDKACRAYSLRGANFISKDPTDPNKTRMAILAHADPGGGIPQWATKTAINAVAPIEPFKLFHRIDKNVINFVANKPTQGEKASLVHTTHGRSSRPAGLSQLGYACFWPKGGGKIGHAEPVSTSDEVIEKVDSDEASSKPPFLES